MTCPKCGRPALKIANMYAHYCMHCDNEITPSICHSVPPVKRKAIKPPSEREAGLVNAIVDVFQKYKFRVLRVGQWRADKSGTTAGTPDLLVGVAGNPLWLGMEVKTAVGVLSPAQKELNENGMTVVVRSPQEALSEARLWFKGGNEGRMRDER